jgi:hypothetical protein
MRMANEAVKVVEVKEKTWLESIGSGLTGAVIFVAAGLVVYFGHFIVNAAILPYFRGLGYLGMVLGIGIIGAAMYQSRKVEQEPTTPFTCPFCDATNLFFGNPTKDFVCESCTRTVHFENGQMVPVRTIVCQACRTEHRVPMNILRYVCDRCNRPLKLSADPTQRVAAASNAQNEAMMHNYDVLLIGFDRRHETATAMKIQNIMTVNLPDARKILASASEKAPIPISWGEPLRKAEALRRQFEELGATVSVKPSAEGTPTSSPKRG